MNLQFISKRFSVYQRKSFSNKYKMHETFDFATTR